MARRDDGSDATDGERTTGTTGTSTPDPVVRSAEAVGYEAVEAADGLQKGLLIGSEHGAPNFALRRFTLDSGAEVPRHTNEVEHEQYVLAGGYVVGIGEEEHTVEAGDSLLIPAGAVHWYHNGSESQGAFLCAVPNGDDEIELAEEMSSE